MKRLTLILALAFCCLHSSAQDPGLQHVFDIRAEIGAATQGEPTADGIPVTIPITGGDVTGAISARILPGGADRQMVDGERHVTRLKAEYEIMTPDSVVIRVTNEGVNRYGAGDYYFMTSPRFECDRASAYAWLTDNIFVCRPVGFGEGEIILRVWMVK